jgi:hypothetical protein
MIWKMSFGSADGPVFSFLGVLCCPCPMTLSLAPQTGDSFAKGNTVFPWFNIQNVLLFLVWVLGTSWYRARGVFYW